jgi:dTDP-glucose 4,6-dehydratase
MLDFARTLPGLKLMIYISTDEVYGVPGGDHRFSETDPPDPKNPYAATKLGAEVLCWAYANTHRVPVITCPSMNLFGERQHPEKFIPSTIRKVLAGETVIIHASPDRKRSGSRHYIHCRNWASAAHFLLANATPGERYNIVGEKEVTNLALAKFIAQTLGMRLHYEMVDFHSSRPGHDLRYALDGSKLAALGWSPPVGFEDSLRKTIQWYLDNPRWLDWSTP